ncbi:hypothetical protein [Deinococcus hopiensis]|uniref:Uncharacterized protein n=1 Tax=Deinococcus hopiensis KR-140 TaxID=695939 RepID=A0A1W1VDP7_9DEIO|nr:hypothetical protein [Deinococcus hopiensis]SMB91171.1 hypothetical protein SAMN00790413_01019 [Deinococcus hopiensis KR-140]
MGLEIERSFVLRNPAKAISDRHQAGVTGREPLLTLASRRLLKKGEKPKAEEQKKLGEYPGALTNWWDEANAWAPIQEAVRTWAALWIARS